MDLRPLDRREAIASSVAVGASLFVPASASSATEVSATWSFHFDHVLGTSLDVLLEGGISHAADMEQVVFAEIERLRKVFSLYDPSSELCSLNQTGGPQAVSGDLVAVLRSYEDWQLRAKGACNPLVGAFSSLWRAAEAVQKLPDDPHLAALSAAIRRPAWLIDLAARTIERLSPFRLDLNAAAKGYVIARISEVIRQESEITSGLVNLGGDMFAWGNSWPVGVQDPENSAENARPLGAIRLQNQAIATSGGYERYFIIDGKRYSHLIDPRTGWPADGVASATVIAPDSVTVNILATTLCILSPIEGLQLIADTPGAAAFIVTADGKHFSSPNFPLLPVEPAREVRQVALLANGDAWPEDFRLTISVELPAIQGGKRYRRPYVAVWIEDAAGKPVKTLTVWGNAPKYLKDLSDWWKIGRGNDALIKAVTRATRGPGKYSVVWDGDDDDGKPAGQGTYTVRVEVHREHGKHLRQSGKIDCKAAPAEIKLEKNEETGETVVAFGKKKSS